ncbi:polysaccharide pyruvyl transferase family protein [Listeria sp. PSOL-1]|uniref:polysaccharide pyruvyl transferase family protein n=1 Tax=Listeria sp. PSOL-1 TaxID=1844999 RepID=UPI0013D67E14|nr:polysaccharide pyruvyl transferase family protein [Listeria sp. PSOL-1]
MTPLDPYHSEDIYTKDRTGYNNGNLAYQYSVFRTLWTEDVVIEADGLLSNPARAAEINEKYDAYVFPLADAFRADFRGTLRNYTKLIKKLKIPVIVTGVGLRADYEPQLEQGFIFDEDVKRFVKAVLEKSAQLGLRGQITADYLKKLGFIENVDYRVIGCPSLYTFGRTLKIRDVHLNEQSKLAINLSPTTSETAIQFLLNTTTNYPNYSFIPQHLDELYLSFAGGPDILSEKAGYPTTIEHKFYQEGRVQYFPNMPSWLEFLKNVDLSVGARLHGNVISTIVGTPNVSFVQDARMRELALYHALPHVTIDKLEQLHNLEDLLTCVDLTSAEKVQTRNFDNYIDFLNLNHLDHIYKEDRGRKVAPLDKIIASKQYPSSTLPITALSKKQVLERIRLASNLLKKRHDFKVNYEITIRQHQIKSLLKEKQALKKTIKTEKATVAKLKEKVNQLMAEK